MVQREGRKQPEATSDGSNRKDDPIPGLSQAGVNLPPESPSRHRCESTAVSSPPSPADSQKRYDLQILVSLRRIIRAIDIHSRKLSSRYDLTAPQLICLLVTARQGPLTGTRISGIVHLSPSTVVGILDRLEKKGLIRRARDLGDRRLVYVTVTEKGAGLAEIAPTPLQDGLANALKRLPELEQAAIALSLGRIVEMMEARDIEAGPILETGALTQNEVEEESGTSDDRSEGR